MGYRCLLEFERSREDIGDVRSCIAQVNGVVYQSHGLRSGIYEYASFRSEEVMTWHAWDPSWLRE